VHRSGDNVRMDLRETGCDGVDWTYLTQDRDQTQMNLRVP
jgi:hypothetical protein